MDRRPNFHSPKSATSPYSAQVSAEVGPAQIGHGIDGQHQGVTGLAAADRTRRKHSPVIALRAAASNFLSILRATVPRSAVPSIMPRAPDGQEHGAAIELPEEDRRAVVTRHVLEKKNVVPDRSAMNEVENTDAMSRITHGQLRNSSPSSSRILVFCRWWRRHAFGGGGKRRPEHHHRHDREDGHRPSGTRASRFRRPDFHQRAHEQSTPATRHRTRPQTGNWTPPCASSTTD